MAASYPANELLHRIVPPSGSTVCSTGGTPATQLFHRQRTVSLLALSFLGLFLHQPYYDLMKIMISQSTAP